MGGLSFSSKRGESTITPHREPGGIRAFSTSTRRRECGIAAYNTTNIPERGNDVGWCDGASSHVLLGPKNLPQRTEDTEETETQLWILCALWLNVLWTTLGVSSPEVYTVLQVQHWN